MTPASKDPIAAGEPDGQDIPEAIDRADAPNGASADGAQAEPDTEATKQAATEEPEGELAKAKAEMLDMADQLARAKAEIYNGEQRFSNYVQRAKADAAQARERGREDVVEALIGVLDEVDLARQHDELHGPFLSIADKLEQTLAQNVGVERFGAIGEKFDPNLHDALMHNTKDDVETDVIDVVMQPGYRVGDKVVRPARVGVAGPA